MRTLLISSIVVAVVAGIDAARGDLWDQFVMLLILGGLSAVALLLDARRASAVRLRPDLLAWVEDLAARTDDEPERVVDRALGAYRAEFTAVPEELADDG